MIEKQKIFDYINNYINDCKAVGDYENTCYITAMQDILNFLERTENERVENENNDGIIEIAKIEIPKTANRRDIVRKLMDESDFFKNLIFADALETYRYYEKVGLVKQDDNCITVYHDCN